MGRPHRAGWLVERPARHPRLAWSPDDLHLLSSGRVHADRVVETVRDIHLVVGADPYVVRRPQPVAADAPHVAPVPVENQDDSGVVVYRLSGAHGQIDTVLRVGRHIRGDSLEVQLSPVLHLLVPVSHRLRVSCPTSPSLASSYAPGGQSPRWAASSTRQPGTPHLEILCRLSATSL